MCCWAGGNNKKNNKENLIYGFLVAVAKPNA
jgi:hypothetical protein